MFNRLKENDVQNAPPQQYLKVVLFSFFSLLIGFTAFAQFPNGEIPPEIPPCVTRCGAGFVLENANDGITCSGNYALTADSFNRNTVNTTHLWEFSGAGGLIDSSSNLDYSYTLSSTPPGVYTLTHTVTNTSCGGTLTQTRPIYLFGKNRRFEFDGLGMRISTDASKTAYRINSGDFTLEAWVTSQGPPDARAIISMGDAQQDGFLFATGQNGETLQLIIAGQQLSSDIFPSIYDGACHHVAVTRLQGDVLFYLDGQLAGKQSFPVSITTFDKLWFGDDSSHTVQPWYGTIDNVRFWNIYQDYLTIQANKVNNVVPGNAAGLIGFWPLNETAVTSQELLDYSLTANNAYLGSVPASEAIDPVSDAQSCMMDNCYISDARVGAPSGKFARNKVNKAGLLAATLTPNPSETESVLLVTGTGTEQCQVKVLNATGKELYSTVAVPGEPLKLGSSLRTGLYFIRITTSTESKVLKLLKR